MQDIIVGKREVQIEKKHAQAAMYLKFAPTTSVEVERSFSKLKIIQSDRRLCLTVENVKKMFIVACNNLQFSFLQMKNIYFKSIEYFCKCVVSYEFMNVFLTSIYLCFINCFWLTFLLGLISFWCIDIYPYLYHELLITEDQ